MKDQKELGLGDFSQDPERHRRRSSTAWTCMYQGVVTGEIIARAVGRDVLHDAGADVRHVRRARASSQPGADADVVVYDPNGHTTIGIDDKTHHMNMDYSA